MMEALLLAMLAATDEPFVGTHLPPDTEFYFAPPVATDYEAIVVSNEGAGRHESRRSIVRSGRWLREESAVEGRTGVILSDFATGLSISYSLEGEGYGAVLIRRHAATDNFSRHRRESTGVHERVLGEDCEIWRTSRVDAPASGPNLLSCDTADGVQLWSRAATSHGSVIAESRTISFRRRLVRAEEIRPPADLLRWSYWRGLSARHPLPAWPVHRPRDFQLHLSGSRVGERERTLRSHGDWSSTNRVSYNGNRLLRIDNRVIAVEYQAEAAGRPVSLGIYRLPLERVEGEDRSGYVRMDPPASEQVIGESCFWSHAASGNEIVITSGEHRSCVTQDGLPLRIYSHHHGINADLTGTRLIRRRPPLSDLLPPSEAFNWAHWGVEPRR